MTIPSPFGSGTGSADRVAPRRSHRAAKRLADDLLRVRCTQSGPDLLVVTAVGEIDVLSARSLQRPLWQEMPAATIVDLSGVTFLSAAGLHVLETAADRAHAERRRLGLVVVARPIVRMLRLIGLESRMPLYSALSDAVREIPEAAPVPARVRPLS